MIKWDPQNIDIARKKLSIGFVQILIFGSRCGSEVPGKLSFLAIHERTFRPAHPSSGNLLHREILLFQFNACW